MARICRPWSSTLCSLLINTASSYNNSEEPEESYKAVQMRYPPEHQKHQQDVNDAKSSSQDGRSRVHVELQVYELDRDAVLTDEWQAGLQSWET